MTNDDVTRFEPISLPPSPKELMDYECLAFTEQLIGDSLYIEPPSDWTVYGPEGDLFDYPIQVTVLGIEGDHVQLGVHRHMSLRLLQGPPPNAEWRREWLESMKYPEDALPALHAGKVATGFAILGNTLFIDDVRAFDGYLGVPEELLAHYVEPDKEVWEKYTCSPHPDFRYEIMEADKVAEARRAMVAIEMWFNKKQYLISVVSNVSDTESQPRSVTLAEQYLPQYAQNLKELMDTYYISTVKLTHW